jgi:hypothetical protein
MSRVRQAVWTVQCWAVWTRQIGRVMAMIGRVLGKSRIAPQ